MGFGEEREKDRKRTMFAMEKPVMSNTMVWKGRVSVLWQGHGRLKLTAVSTGGWSTMRHVSMR
jgi:hypothetical protein